MAKELASELKRLIWLYEQVNEPLSKSFSYSTRSIVRASDPNEEYTVLVLEKNGREFCSLTKEELMFDFITKDVPCESTPCDVPWIPIVGEECSVVFGSTSEQYTEQCTILALHKHHAWITAGKTEVPLTVASTRLIRKEC